MDKDDQDARGAGAANSGSLPQSSAVRSSSGGSTGGAAAGAGAAGGGSTGTTGGAATAGAATAGAGAAGAPPGGAGNGGNGGQDGKTNEEHRAVGIFLATIGLLLLCSVYLLWPREGEVQAVPTDAVVQQANEGRAPVASQDPARDVQALAAPAATEGAAPTPPPGSQEDQSDEGATTEGKEVEGAEPVDGTTSAAWANDIQLLFWELQISPLVRILLLVILVGALGSVIGGATSYATYVGNKKFAASWSWWYYLRPLIGATLALVFYLVVRAGFFEAFKDSDLDQHLLRATAIAALTGMFSKLTTDKLEDIFQTILQSDKDKKRTDKVDENSRPKTTEGNQG